jgi:hypothetical protein
MLRGKINFRTFLMAKSQWPVYKSDRYEKGGNLEVREGREAVAHKK